MIQVLERAYTVVGLLAEQDLTLAALTRATGLHKPTLHNILASLQELGVVRRAPSGEYTLGDALFALAAPRLRRDVLHRAAQSAAADLAREIQERTVVAVLRHGIRYKIVQIESTRSVTVNPLALERRSPYDASTGRVLLAHLETSELDEVVRARGYPGSEWADITSRPALLSALAAVRQNGIAYHTTPDSEVHSVAVPVFGPDGRVWAAIGVSVPSTRFVGNHRNQIVASLRTAAEAMCHELTLSLDEQESCNRSGDPHASHKVQREPEQEAS